MKILYWILLLPIYWLGSVIIWFVSSLLIGWFDTFATILYWIAVPQVFLFGGIIFPIGLIVAILEESLKLGLPMKPVLILLLINNLLGWAWTFSTGDISINNESDIFGILFSIVNLLAVIYFLFTKGTRS